MAAKPHTASLPSLVLLLLLSIFRVYAIDGFTVDLIPRDALQSMSLTPSERIRNSLLRSFNRARFFGANFSQELASTDIVSDKGEFLMKFSIGTPPVQTLAIADTGSDLTWIQCKPCEDCYKQKPPLFDPARSSSYKAVPCSSDTCKSVRSTSCRGTKTTCGYTIGYGDRSTSKGDIATETLSFGGLSTPNFIMGCGHADRGTFSPDTAGIVGLGGGTESLITQLKSSIHGKFSYCLIPMSSSGATPSSKMNFGESSVVSGAGVVSTPLVSKSPATFYHLTLERITVGGKRLDYLESTPSRASKAEEGNIIIDSGTTLTFLPPEFYSKLVAAVKEQVKLKQVVDPAGLLKLCYEATQGEGGSKVPDIVMHFKGADLRLKSSNTFVWTTAKSMCLAFAPASTVSGVAIYGNVAQTDFLVGYDLEKKTVSFKPTDCSKGGTGAGEN